MMLTIDDSNGGAILPTNQDPHHGAPGTSDSNPRGSHGSGGGGIGTGACPPARRTTGGAGGGGGGGSAGGGSSSDGDAIRNRRDVLLRDNITTGSFAPPSGFHGAILQAATGGGGGGGGDDTPVPGMELQGQYWKMVFKALSLACVLVADHVAIRVKSPTLLPMVRDLCAQASFAVPAAALHALHRWGLVGEATRAAVARAMPTWDAAWMVFSVRDAPTGGEASGGGGGDDGGETLPGGGGDGGGGGRRHHARRHGMIWRLIFWWIVRLGLAVVGCCLARFVGKDSPSAVAMLRGWCTPTVEFLLSALLCDLYLWGAVDTATWGDIAARLPDWCKGA
eukprot:g13261.t1